MVSEKRGLGAVKLGRRKNAVVPVPQENLPTSVISGVIVPPLYKKRLSLTLHCTYPMALPLILAFSLDLSDRALLVRKLFILSCFLLGWVRSFWSPLSFSI